MPDISKIFPDDNPQVYIEIIPQVINILGFNLQYGEDDVVGIRWAAGDEANDFKSYFDTAMVDCETVLGLTAIVGGVAFGASIASGPQNANPAAAILALITFIAGQEFAYIQTVVDNQVSEDNGLQVCFENYWIYPQYTFALQGLVIENLFNDWNIWVRHWIGDTWDLAFPHYTYPFILMVPWLQSQAIAWSFSLMVQEIGSIFGYNQWSPVDAEYPLPSPTPGSTGLLYPAVNTYDDEENPIDSGVYIDGQLVGSNNPTLYLTPETHYVGVDKRIPTGGGYGYTFSYMTIEGNNYYNPVEAVELSTNSTISAHYTYGPLVYTVSVNAYDAWIGYNFPIESNVYIDDVWAGTTPDDFQLSYGWHSIATDEYVWDQYIDAWDISDKIGPYDQYESYMITGHHYYFFVQDDINIGASYHPAP